MYATEIAGQYGISADTLKNLITCESGWDQDADNGDDRGLLQINRKWHPEITDEQAFDVYWSMRYAAQEIKKGNIDQWVCANCYAYAKVLWQARNPGKAFPSSKVMKANLKRTPYVGAIAVYNYDGTPHYAYVTSKTATTHCERGTNLAPATPYQRCVPITHPNLLGYW